jgi:ATP-dependent DNA ligase
MADYKIMKAVEFDKCSAKFKKENTILGLIDKGWWVQPKYDGCFGMAVIRREGISQMLSRTGEDYTPSCLHILEELKSAAKNNGYALADFVVLGEVWHPDMQFPNISGTFRKNQRSQLHFISNDLLHPWLNTTTCYEERFANLKRLLPTLSGGGFCVHVTENFFECEDPQGLATKLVEYGGYDGVIMRDPGAGYKIGLAKEGQIIKVKPTKSLDLRVTAVNVSCGEKTGRNVYTIAVLYKGVYTTVGSGVPHKIHELPFVRDIVEVECLGITEDGKLREPRYKGIRTDKLSPDE